MSPTEICDRGAGAKRGAVILLAGPTAGGKSALALELASRLGGVVINADSMQVYRELRVLTARPSAAEEARVRHRLYGFLSAAERCSAARWRTAALVAIDQAWSAGRPPIVVGGTGFYLRALRDGLAPIPDIAPAVMAAAERRLVELGHARFHAELADRDPRAADRLAAGDRQRMIRAWAVAKATGKTLSDWQAEAGEALAAPIFTILLMPARAELYARAERRFAAMVKAGAIDEVRLLRALGLNPALPAMKTLGVAQIAAYLAGEVDLETAIARGQQATRNYIKRQTTWFRHQLKADLCLPATADSSISDLAESAWRAVSGFLLTLPAAESSFCRFGAGAATESPGAGLADPANRSNPRQ